MSAIIVKKYSFSRVFFLLLGTHPRSILSAILSHLLRCHNIFAMLDFFLLVSYFFSFFRFFADTTCRDFSATKPPPDPEQVRGSENLDCELGTNSATLKYYFIKLARFVHASNKHTNFTASDAGAGGRLQPFSPGDSRAHGEVKIILERLFVVCNGMFSVFRAGFF